MVKIRGKRPGLNKTKILCYYFKTFVRTSRTASQIFTQLWFETLDRPLYSSELMLADFHFTKFEDEMKRIKF